MVENKSTKTVSKATIKLIKTEVYHDNGHGLTTRRQTVSKAIGNQYFQAIKFRGLAYICDRMNPNSRIGRGLLRERELK